MKTSKFLRVVALMIVAVMVMTAVGCGAGGATSEIWEEEVITVSGTQNNSNPSNTDNPTNDTSNGGPSTDKKYDLKGKSVILAGWLTGFEPQPTSKTYKEQMDLIAKIQEKYNCKITFKNSTESLLLFSEWATATLAGQRFSDITYMASNQYFPQCALKGFLTQLDGRIDFNDPCWVYDVFRATELKGKHYYALPTQNAHSMAGNGLMFNKEVFRKLGVKTPYEYVKEGNWTFETFRDTAVACTRNEGGVQYFGFASPSTSAFVRANGGSSSYMKDGKEVFGLETDQSIAAIEFVRKLYNENKVIPKATGSTAKFTDGTIAMSTNSWYGLATTINDMGSELIGYTYMPKGPNVNDYNYTGYECNLVGVTNYAIDADACAAIMSDWFAIEKWKPTMEETLENYAPDETSLNVLIDCTQRAMASIEMVGFYDWYWRNVWWTDLGVSANTPARTYVAGVKDKAQQSIDEIWNLLDTFQ